MLGLDASRVPLAAALRRLVHEVVPSHGGVGVDRSGLGRAFVIHTATHAEHAQAAGHAAPGRRAPAATSRTRRIRRNRTGHEPRPRPTRRPSSRLPMSIFRIIADLLQGRWNKTGQRGRSLDRPVAHPIHGNVQPISTSTETNRSIADPLVGASVRERSIVTKSRFAVIAQYHGRVRLAGSRVGEPALGPRAEGAGTD